MSQTQPVSAPESASEAVVQAVAEAEGVEPVELTSPLYDVIDPEALNHLFSGEFSGADVTGRVVFSYHGYEVTVSEEGDVSVASLGERAV